MIAIARMAAGPVEDAVKLIPAIQARRAIGILDSDEALYLISGEWIQGTLPAEYDKGAIIDVASSSGSGNTFSVLATSAFLTAQGGPSGTTSSCPTSPVSPVSQWPRGFRPV